MPGECFHAHTHTHSWQSMCFVDALRYVPIPFFTHNQMACFEHVRDIEAENAICFVWHISEICLLSGILPEIKHRWQICRFSTQQLEQIPS